ncbi:beta-N-acetylhexosaminidase [Bacillus massiliglaciei]|uniref:beta-N-acetylhexosaminidase n=1 Tax=Bacillus massiliglaciei TaxID=1816693 RepID=UPI000ABDF30E|nr:beta-N-acetylhexosaminidase [Bacillus massiliglaciei]
MKKRYQVTGLLLIALLSCWAVIFFMGDTTSDTVSEKEKKSTETTVADSKTEAAEKQEKKTEPSVEETTDVKVKKLLKKMTLEEKIGQLMMVGFSGTEKSDEIKELIEDKNIGGIIYFDRNMASPVQVAELSNSLQKSAKKTTHSLPLMIAVDQEGGEIIRMKNQVSPLPSQQDLGKQASAEETYEVANINGRELSSMGININFAPVLDLSKTDTRSFGTDPEKAYQYGAKSIQGLNDASVTGALKHFPGNGRSEIDPHVDTSSVEANQSDLENSDMYPFKKMISEMDNEKFFVMVTHIKYPAYDKEQPASLSKIIIQDLLRTKLGYKGIVVTDDLEMGAVNKYFSYKDMGREAIIAGADLLLVCHEYDHQTEVYDGIMEAVKSGEIPLQRIDEAAERVLTYKLEEIEKTSVNPKQAGVTVKSQPHIKYLENLANR